ncbi:MAG: hypothetical protein Ct9H300mP8_06850 [Gammaproteobacteria bacterium]|nr:MAG: hypothetical protein Ct9H300mP8_06850 [Gammaproteobacteria bacterium]
MQIRGKQVNVRRKMVLTGNRVFYELGHSFGPGGDFVTAEALQNRFDRRRRNRGPRVDPA